MTTRFKTRFRSRLSLETLETRNLLAGGGFLIEVASAPDPSSLSNAVGDNSSTRPAIRRDGRYVAFVNEASELISGDNNNAREVFLKEKQTGNVNLASG
jgi:hypothetical protein